MEAEGERMDWERARYRGAEAYHGARSGEARPSVGAAKPA
jgi:hypothetical protein